MALVFSGTTVYPIDDAIWEGVKQYPGLSKLAMGAITPSQLTYFFSGEGKAGQYVSVLMKNVTGRDYKKVSSQFAQILRKIDGTRDVRYSYQYRARMATFELKYDGKTLFDLDDAIQRAMAAEPLFVHTAKGPSINNRFVYYYYDYPVEQGAAAGLEAGLEAALPDLELRAGVSGLVERYDPCVVKVLCHDEAGKFIGHGSGFFVDPEGYILTNAHVIKDVPRLTVQTFDGVRYQVLIIKRDDDLDLALIKLKTPKSDFPSVAIGDSRRAKKGEKILIIGTPLSTEYEHSAVTGVISGTDRQSGRLQTSAPTYSGNSGSPVISCLTGRVIGVHVASPVMQGEVAIRTKEGLKETNLVAKSRAESMGLVIPVNYARQLLEMIK